MRDTEVAIIGGGLAGSTAAAMLGRAGITTVVVDPHTTYPPDLRCEKLGGDQIDILRRTGLADAILRATTHDRHVWVARFGRLVQKRPSDQYGIMYDTLVNTMRAQIPPTVEVIADRATALSTSADRQTVTLGSGETISARLVVLASGLSVALRDTIGLTREVTSPCHSITIAFDLAPKNHSAFGFPALTYYPERASDRMAYFTLFPIGEAMHVNLMVYRAMDDPWLRQMRHAPEAALHALMPRLRRITGEIAVTGPVKIRPADLYVTHGHRQPGVVLVGDAFATSCPAAGTGTDKVFTDVERLCNVHIPDWLATPGMGADKIAAFYDDTVKTACDAWSTAKAHHLRSLSTDTALRWRAGRWARFLVRLTQGQLARLRTPRAVVAGAAGEPPQQGRVA